MDTLLKFLEKFIGIENPLNLLVALLGCIVYVIYLYVTRISNIQNEHQVKVRKAELEKELTMDESVERLHKDDVFPFILQYMRIKLIKELTIIVLLFISLWLIVDILTPNIGKRKVMNLDSANRAIQQRFK
jgi:hypothetical protein